MPNQQRTALQDSLASIVAAYNGKVASVEIVAEREHRLSADQVRRMLYDAGIEIDVDGRYKERADLLADQARRLERASPAPRHQPAPARSYSTGASATPPRLRAEAPAQAAQASYSLAELEARRAAILGHPAARGKQAAATELLFAAVSIDDAIRLLGGEPTAPTPVASAPSAPPKIATFAEISARRQRDVEAANSGRTATVHAPTPESSAAIFARRAREADEARGHKA